MIIAEKTVLPTVDIFSNILSFIICVLRR